MTKHLFTALIFGALLTSCTLDPECVWDDSYPEFETYDLLPDLEQVDLVLHGRNQDDDINLYTGYIVRNDSAYEVLTEFSRQDSCDYCNYPQINFSEYTLVGYTTEIGCYSVNYLKVSATSEGLRYAIKTLDESRCNSVFCDNFSFNWVLVPKSADTAEITFEDGIARYDCDC